MAVDVMAVDVVVVVPLFVTQTKEVSVPEVINVDSATVVEEAAVTDEWDASMEC